MKKGFWCYLGFHYRGKMLPHGAGNQWFVDCKRCGKPLYCACAGPEAHWGHPSSR